MESTLVEVLIPGGLGNDRFYKVVTWVGLKVLEELKDRAGEVHDLRASEEAPE